MNALLLVAVLAQPIPYNISNFGPAAIFTVDFQGIPTRVLVGCHTRKWALPDMEEEVHEIVPNSVMDNWITEACNEPLKQLEEWL